MVEQPSRGGWIDPVGQPVAAQDKGTAQRLAWPGAPQIGQRQALRRDIGRQIDQSGTQAGVPFGGGGNGIAARRMTRQDGWFAEGTGNRQGVIRQRDPARRRGNGATAGQVDCRGRNVGIVGKWQDIAPAPGPVTGPMNKKEARQNIIIF